MTSPSDAERTTEELRANFENRVGIYSEKGAVRLRLVQVSVKDEGTQHYLSAVVELIPAPGLEDSNLYLHLHRGSEFGPIR